MSALPTTAANENGLEMTFIGAIKRALRPVRQRLRYLKFRAWSPRHARHFECPICEYRGPFEEMNDPSGRRRHSRCPKCGALERHRIQFLALQKVLTQRPSEALRILHFAPEPCLATPLRMRFGHYETADLNQEGVDHSVDLTHLPFADASYDVVYASHVLEHIADEARALAEIRRVLRPNGFAVLAVPLVGETTVEYGAADSRDFGHVRAPGYDYYRLHLGPFFSRVEEYDSAMFPEMYQVFVYEDRTRWPNARSPKRPGSSGEKHRDVVAICYP